MDGHPIYVGLPAQIWLQFPIFCTLFYKNHTVFTPDKMLFCVLAMKSLRGRHGYPTMPAALWLLMLCSQVKEPMILIMAQKRQWAKRG